MQADIEEELGYHMSGPYRHPVKLIRYADGSMDLHSQTGEGHTDSIEKAVTILRSRGLEVGHSEFMGGSGMYYPVRKAGAFSSEKTWTREGPKRGRWVKM